jgi:hypothetical protein
MSPPIGKHGAIPLHCYSKADQRSAARLSAGGQPALDWCRDGCFGLRCSARLPRAMVLEFLWVGIERAVRNVPWLHVGIPISTARLAYITNTYFLAAIRLCPPAPSASPRFGRMITNHISKYPNRFRPGRALTNPILHYPSDRHRLTPPWLCSVKMKAPSQYLSTGGFAPSFTSRSQFARTRSRFYFRPGGSAV